MFARYGDTRGMDHMRLHPMRTKPARQPEAVAAGFEGHRNPRDRAAGPDRLIPPAMEHGKQLFWARLQLLARLTLNAGKHAANQPARLAHLDDGNDRAILVQGDEGPAQVVRLGHRGTPSVHAATKLPLSRRPPHSISWSHFSARATLSLFATSRNSAPGDYPFFNSNHIPDGTIQEIRFAVDSPLE